MSGRATARGAPALRLPVERYDLRCGARLVVSPRPGAPVVAAQIAVRGGHSLDPEGLEGTALLTGALTDQGTRTHDERALAELLETAGAHVQGDATGLTGSMPGDRWKLLLDVLSELVTEPRYPAARVARQKRRLLDRLTVERADPRVQGERLFRRLVYGEHWLGRASSGTVESVERIEPRHLRAHHARHWVGRRSIVSVCGDVDPDAVRRHLDRRLAGWKAGLPLPPPDERMPPPGVRTGVFESSREQVHVFLGHLGVRRNDPDYPPLVVLDHVLGTGPGLNDRLSTRLREEQGLAYTVSANIHGSAGVLPGTFLAYIGTSPRHVPAALRGFQEEIRRIREEPVPAAELRTAIDFLVGSFALGFQRSSRRVGFLISQERHGLPDDYLARLPRLLSEVTSADVQRVARAHLWPDACCVAAAGPLTRRDLDAAVRRASRR